MKRCANCRWFKPETEFSKLSRAKDGLFYRCRECAAKQRKKYVTKNREANKRWYEENKVTYLANRTKKRTPEHTRRKWIWERYGLTDADYDALVEKQGGVCAICGQTDRDKPLSVDHDHIDGGVRGLLCFRCNMGLGLFGDMPTRLREAAQYLEEYAWNDCIAWRR
jgi:protein-arginine kinase activator protein McsA